MEVMIILVPLALALGADGSRRFPLVFEEWPI